MRRLAALLLIFFLIPQFAHAESQNDNRVHCYMNGYDLNQRGEVETFLVDDRTFVPASVLKACGFEITLDESGKNILIASGDKSVQMTLGEKQYRRGESQFDMDVAPFERDGEVYLPLRFVAAGLDMPVDWNGEARVVAIGSFTEDESEGTEERTTTKEGYSFVVPGALQQDFIIEDNGGEVHFYDKKNYRRADHIGRIGTMSKVKDPSEVDVPMILLTPVPGGYLIFTYAENSGLSEDAAPELKQSYEDSKEAIKDILKSAKTLERVSLAR